MANSTLNKRSRTVIATLVIVACVLGATPKTHAQQDVRAALVVRAQRKPAPTFHLASANGKTMQTSDYRGKVVLLNFWATKCGGCVLEIPSFIELQQKYEKSGFTAVGISSDVSYSGLKNDAEGWQLVRPFMASHKINYPILMGNDSLVGAYGFDLYPATYLLDKSGKIAATYVGVVDKNDVEANVKVLLAER